MSQEIYVGAILEESDACTVKVMHHHKDSNRYLVNVWWPGFRVFPESGSCVEQYWIKSDGSQTVAP